jgi:hypothetical protein
LNSSSRLSGRSPSPRPWTCNLHWFSGQFPSELVGLYRRFGHETMTFAELLTADQCAALISPLQRVEVDIGEAVPARCLKHGLWLATNGDLPFAVLLSPGMNYGRQTGMHVEVAVPSGEDGAALSRQLSTVSRSSTRRLK